MLMDVTVNYESDGKQVGDESLLPSCYFGAKAAGDKIYACALIVIRHGCLKYGIGMVVPTSVFRLDRPVTIMTVDTEARRLITKDAEHYDKIYLYELPPVDY